MAPGPLAREQVAVDDLPEQGVAEHEMGIGGAARRDEDPPVDDLAECRSNHRRRQLGHRGHQLVVDPGPAAEATRRTSWPASDTAARRASTTSRRRGGRTPSLVSRAAARTCSA